MYQKETKKSVCNIQIFIQYGIPEEYLLKLTQNKSPLHYR